MEKEHPSSFLTLGAELERSNTFARAWIIRLHSTLLTESAGTSETLSEFNIEGRKEPFLANVLVSPTPLAFANAFALATPIKQVLKTYTAFSIHRASLA